MKRIVVYTRSGRISPASYYRILQYLPYLEENIEERHTVSSFLFSKHNDVNTRLQKLFWYSLYYLQIQIRLIINMIRDIINPPDCTILLRAVSPKLVFPFGKFLMDKGLSSSKYLIWDFDDNIIKNGEITKAEKEIIYKYAKKIVVTSNILKNILPAELHNIVSLLPTTDKEFADIDLDIINVKRKEKYQKSIELLWLATSSSLPNLDKVINALDESALLLNKLNGKQLVLNVVCNKKYEPLTKSLIINNVRWTPEKAKEYALKCHIGIMPLYDNEINRGKGGFKLIQYMSCGMPSIASDVGYNTEVIIHEKTGFLLQDNLMQDSWTNSIIKLSEDWDYYLYVSDNSRKRYNEYFSFESNLEFWKKILSNSNSD